VSSSPVTFITADSNDRLDHVDIAATADGGFVLTWESTTSATGTVRAYLQRFDAAGKALGQATLLDSVSATSATGSLDSSVAVGADGRIISAWSPDRVITSTGDDGAPPGYTTAQGTNQIQVRVLASNGAVTTHTVTVGGTNTSVEHVDVAATLDGGFVLAWEETYDWGGTVSAYVQRFDAAGKALGQATLLDSVSALSATGSLDASVAVGMDGRIISAWSPDTVTVWNGSGAPPNYTVAEGSNKIEVRIVATNGVVTSHTVTVGASSRVDHVDVAATADGSFVLSWESTPNMGGTVNAYVQRFDAAGKALGQATLLDSVSALSASGSLDTSVAVGADGRIISAWSPDLVTVSDGNGAPPGYTTAEGSNKIIIDNGSASNQPPVVTQPDTPVVTPPRTIETATSLTLPDGTLNLVASGVANISLTGNALDNSITGNVGKNSINGGAGSDKLNGGFGNDLLTGGSGKDTFVFTTKLGTAVTDRKVNFDTITDFKSKEDKLWLDNSIFKKLGAKGSESNPARLDKKFFTVGDRAKDKDDYLIYNKKTGVLSYDADGSGKAQAVEFALLKNKPTLKFDDIFVI